MPKLATRYDWSSFIQLLRSEQFLALTQEQLAHELGVSVSSVSKWESASIEPQVKTRTKLRALAEEAGFLRELWPLKEQKAPRAVSGSGTGNK